MTWCATWNNNKQLSNTHLISSSLYSTTSHLLRTLLRTMLSSTSTKNTSPLNRNSLPTMRRRVPPSVGPLDGTKPSTRGSSTNARKL
jgi:hypothetical protein